MSKTKSYLMDLESKYYTLAEKAIRQSETQTEAVHQAIALAEKMGITDYLGGIDEIDSMVCDAWYEIQTSLVQERLMGFHVIVKFKDGDVYTRCFTQRNQAKNYLQTCMQNYDAKVEYVTIKEAQVIYQVYKCNICVIIKYSQIVGELHADNL